MCLVTSSSCYMLRQSLARKALLRDKNVYTTTNKCLLRLFRNNVYGILNNMYKYVGIARVSRCPRRGLSTADSKCLCN